MFDATDPMVEVDVFLGTWRRSILVGSTAFRSARGVELFKNEYVMQLLVLPGTLGHFMCPKDHRSWLETVLDLS